MSRGDGWCWLIKVIRRAWRPRARVSKLPHPPLLYVLQAKHGVHSLGIFSVCFCFFVFSVFLLLFLVGKGQRERGRQHLKPAPHSVQSPTGGSIPLP